MNRRLLIILFAAFCLLPALLSAQSDDPTTISTLTAEGVRDWVEINRDILGNERVTPETAEKSLAELELLRDRAGDLIADAGDSAVDQINRRILNAAIEDIKRLNELHGTPPDGNTILAQYKEIGNPQTREEKRSAIVELNRMIDSCSRGVRTLYAQKRTGSINNKDFSTRMHGPDGYDRIVLTLIHRKDALQREILKMDTASRLQYEKDRPSIVDEIESGRPNTRPSIIDELEPRPTATGNGGFSEEEIKRAAAAALFSGEGLSPGQREVVIKRLADEATAPSPEQIQRDAAYAEQAQRAEIEEALRLSRIAEGQQRRQARDELNRLNLQRKSADEAASKFADEADASARHNNRSAWTEEEEAEHARLADRAKELHQLTPLEQHEILQLQQGRIQAQDDIDALSLMMGTGVSQYEIDQRLRDFNETNAATKTWREFFATGQMYSAVAEDRYKQNERAIRADLRAKAADYYLQRDDLTPQQRSAAHQIQLAAVHDHMHAVQAGLVDDAVIVAGAGVDLVTVGAGGPAAKVASKIKQVGARVLRGGGTTGTRAGSTGATAAETLIDDALPTTPAPTPTPRTRPATIVETTPATRPAPVVDAVPPKPQPSMIDNLESKIAELQRPAEERIARPQSWLEKDMSTLEDFDLGSVPETATAPHLSAPPNTSHAAAQRATENVLRRQNIAAEQALEARLAQQADESKNAFQSALNEGRELSDLQLSNQYQSVLTRNTNQEMNHLIQEARRLNLPEQSIREATELAFQPMLPTRGAADAVHNLSRLVAEGNGYRVIPTSEAIPVMRTATRVARGTARVDELEYLRRNIDAARQRGGNFFEELRRTGTVTRDGNIVPGANVSPGLRGSGYRPVTTEPMIKLLEKFAQENGLTP